MIRRGEIDVGVAFAAHVCGLLFGVATVVGLVPAMAKLARMLAVGGGA